MNATWRGFTTLKLCIAGAAGKMGKAIIAEASTRGHQIVGAIEAVGNSCIGKSLKELGIAHSNACIVGADRLAEVVTHADIYVTFTTPAAEVVNLPVVANLGKKIVLGTTGFTEEQNRQIRDAVEGKVPAVFSPNYSVGINVFFKLIEVLRAFPTDYNFSISEVHHTAKKDAPSGTAKKLGEIVAGTRGYKTTVYGREGISLRKPEELEIVAIRAGGVPGIHDLIIAGPYEMLRIEHTAFSRQVFAQGAVYAAEWLSNKNQPRIFSMQDVLNF